MIKKIVSNGVGNLVQDLMFSSQFWGKVSEYMALWLRTHATLAEVSNSGPNTYMVGSS